MAASESAAAVVSKTKVVVHLTAIISFDQYYRNYRMQLFVAQTKFTSSIPQVLVRHPYLKNLVDCYRYHLLLQPLVLVATISPLQRNHY